MSETPSLSRRDFLKMAGVGAAAVASLSLKGSIPEAGEALKQNEIAIAALRVEGRPDEDSLKRVLRVMDQIKNAARSQPLDLIITPEYTFSLLYGKDKGYKPMPLVIEPNGTEFVVNKLKSHNATRVVIEIGQYIASSYKTNLILATFNDYHSENNAYLTTSIFIDTEGKIVGLKRKDNLPLIGKFEIKRGGQTYKILPMICGEVWNEREEDSTSGNFKTIPPDWVREGAPWDIFAHSMAQGDLDFNKLAAITQKTQIPEGSLPQDESWMRNVFSDYYGGYLSYLKPNTPILVADNNMAGCFNKDLSTMKKYEDRGEFIVAKCDLTQ